MVKNPPDERLVYLALKNIFKGSEAQSRNVKTIRKHILHHQTNSEVHSLIKEHNLDNVINTARVLLEEDIFASTLKAKIRFPEVFEVSPDLWSPRRVGWSQNWVSTKAKYRTREAALNG